MVLEDQLQLTGLKLYQGADGLYVGYPHNPDYRGEDYRMVFFPVVDELRDHIEETVVEEYLRSKRPEVFTEDKEELVRILFSEQDELVKRVLKKQLS